jgi:hypothetical protein
MDTPDRIANIVKYWQGIFEKEVPGASSAIKGHQISYFIRPKSFIDRVIHDHTFADMQGGMFLGLKIFNTRITIKGKQRNIVWGLIRYADGGHEYEAVVVNNKTKAADLVGLKRRFRAGNYKPKLIKPILPSDLLDLVLKNSIEFLQQWRSLKQHNVKLARGILFYGPPGNGKTMVTRYLQDLAIKHKHSTSSVECQEIKKQFGAGEPLNKLFSREGLTFYDDMDMSLLTRTITGQADIACAVLSAMDGMRVPVRGAVRIFSTNEDTANIDAAFLRPGRIDLRVKIDKPNAEQIEEYFERFADKSLLDFLNDNYLMYSLVEFCQGKSFAEIDMLRTMLVFQHFVDNKEYDLQEAFDNFNLTREVDSKIKVGFRG